MRVARAAVTLMWLLPLRTMTAQSARSVTLRVDNDAFNFWRTPGARPDEEYTSGVHLSYDGSAAPWWSRRLSPSLPACSAGLGACRARRFELGQNIYTPRRTRDSLTPPPGSRANSAWLFVEETARVLRSGRSDEYGIALGVTGEPALGQFAQRVAHSFAPGFNRPTDWTDQVGFEPGVILRYEHTRLVRAGAVQVLPRARVELGNVRTAAEAGIRARAGVRLRHPWLAANRDAGPELAFSIGGAARGIARDLFLDGNTFDPEQRVGHEPLVLMADWSLTLRRKWLMLAYGAVSESRAYARGPALHSWSSLTAAVTFEK